MALTILGEMLVEEYDRCQRHKRCWQEAHREAPKRSDRRKECRRCIRRCNKDMRMIRRALGFALRPGLKQFKENQRQWEEQYYRPGAEEKE